MVRWIEFLNGVRAAIPLFDLWTRRDAVESLTEMVRDPLAPQGVRLGAYRELQKVLARIERDEKGSRTNVSRILDALKAGPPEVEG
ncbi:hypothetical protein ACU4GI_44830 [Cupriavidus basilensis]